MNGFLKDYIDTRLSPKAPKKEVKPVSGVRQMYGYEPPASTRQILTVEETRQMIIDSCNEYFATPNPDHILLITPSAGVGKTWQGINFAYDVLENSLNRVFFAGQRKDAIGDLLTASEAQGHDPKEWLQWLPRQNKPDEIELHTCKHEIMINSWMQRGYAANDFCKSVSDCGWEYMKECPYHKQKTRQERIVFGQHAHLVLGHPLMSQCQVMIGDENPMGVFPKTWLIPSKFLYTPEMDWEDPLTEIFYTMRELLSDEKLVLSGPDLLDALGGAQAVYDACESFTMPLNALLAPRIRKAEDAKEVDYNFIPYVVPLMLREATCGVNGEEYIERLTLRGGSLEIAMRNYVNESVPQHVVWFDATGEKRFYEAMFGRKVKVIDAVPEFVGRVWQVHDRLNGKGTLLPTTAADRDPAFEKMFENEGDVDYIPKKEEGEVVKGVQDAKTIFNLLKSRHADASMISFNGLTKYFEDDFDYMHFYANRGSNKLEGTDALIVYGTPMPSVESMIERAKAIYFDRMKPFDTRFVPIERAYGQDDDGEWIGNITREFADEDLNVILWQSREAELIQSINRARPVINDVDIYLFSNVPVDGIPPYKVLSVNELVGADIPEGFSTVSWVNITMSADRIFNQYGAVTAKNLADESGVSMRVAYRAINALLDMEGDWEMAITRVDSSRSRAIARREG